MAEGHDAGSPQEHPARDLVPADDELTPASAFEPLPSLDVDANLSIAVDLPSAQPHEVPEDEAAVAIDEVPVDPGFVPSPSEPTTMSVAIVASRLATTPPDGSAEGAGDGSADAVTPLPSGEPYSGSRRDRLRGEHSVQPEPAAMLTADRLLEVNRKTRPGPEGPWQRFVYNATFRTVNLGDSAAVRARKELDHRIQKHLEGGARFVPVLTRKGGVGKTTVTTLLGMALASAREDRIIAIDANPDRGTLSERVPKQTRATVRDVVHKAASIGGFTDFSALVSRDETRLDILASDTDPLLSEAFDENDYNVVADLSARFYSIVLTDCGTGIVHSVMRATLQRADSLVIVSGGSVDEARLASETLTWLETNGYAQQARDAIVVLNQSTPGTPLVRLGELQAHFASRARSVVRVPYDPQIAAGGTIVFANLLPETRKAARELAALLVEGLRTKAA